VTGVPQGNASSPYSSGGGGVTLERRIAALYLAQLLTGGTSPELGDDRAIVAVRFQQSPRVPIDDLVIDAARDGETQPSLELAIGIRRRPNFVQSDETTKKLVVEFVRALLNAPDDGREHRLALAAAGRQTHAAELAELAALAHDQMDAETFFALLGEPDRFRQGLTNRLDHLKRMVSAALAELKVEGVDDARIDETTWRLLNRLTVLTPEVESPDLADWSDVQNRLIAVARGRDLAGAGRLLERLEVLAGRYGPNAATVNQSLLRRDVHSLLDTGRSRSGKGWDLLNLLQNEARVSDELGATGSPGDGEGLHLDREAEARELIAAIDQAAAVIVAGESGVGKSAVVMNAVAAAVQDDEGHSDAVVLNLRLLPQRPLDLAHQLECGIEVLLSDLSAPRRLLVVDAADAAAEGWGDMLAHLVQSAVGSDVRMIVIASDDAEPAVREIVTSRLHDAEPTTYSVKTLDDGQLGQIAERFPQLSRLLSNARSRELLRRLVVADLLVRSEFTATPLSEADALSQVWAGLVRRHENRDRGVPDARERTLLQLATRELTDGSSADLAPQLDTTALDGLRRDGLLRSSELNPWQAVPDFAHDEIRRLAVARVLLADGDPASALANVGAPRWAFSAGRLACQASLALPAQRENPLAGRLGRIQAAFDGLAAVHGPRWSDLPAEALLTLGDPSALLSDAWPALMADDQTGFRRLARIVQQQHQESLMIDSVVAEPIVALLLDGETPWTNSDAARDLLRGWLRGLVFQDIPAGQPLRVRLRERLLAFAERAEVADQERRREADAARAARVADQSDQGTARTSRRFPQRAVLGGGDGRTRRRPTLPRPIRDDLFLELLALLGPDLGEAGEQFLRRIADDAPGDLAPALEAIGADRALANYGHGLLADLTESYYLDDREDDWGLGRDGIRPHTMSFGIGPFAAWYRGPFKLLFQTDFRRGVAVLNRMLNHAARARARTIAAHGNPWHRAADDEADAVSFEMHVTGAAVRYAGDAQTWLWYRGTGVGPYPCMSALQALERVCDQLVSMDLPVDRIIEILMDGCENLAMPALVVGLLVRHLEKAGTLLDPFLAEPVAWELEFSRVTHELTGFAADSKGLVEPERREWSLRETASFMTIYANPDRAAELRLVGERLVARAREIEADDSSEPETADDDPPVQAGAPRPEDPADPSLTTVVEAWASALDRSSYRTYVDENGQAYVQSVPPKEVEEALREGNEDLQRGNEAMRIQRAYFADRVHSRPRTAPPTGDELAADLATAEQLVADPPSLAAVDMREMASAIAAHTVEVVLLGDAALPEQAQRFAVNVLVEVAEATPVADPEEIDGWQSEPWDGRAVARSIPLLLLPQAAELLTLLDTDDGPPRERLIAAAMRMAHATSDERRVRLARGMDAIWISPCAVPDVDRDPHQVAFQLAVESIRDCVLGQWGSQSRPIERIEDPVAEALSTVDGDDVYVPHLDPGIRALGVAANITNCVSDDARALLLELLGAQRRGLLAYDSHFDERGTHTLEAARALLNLAAAGDDGPLNDTIDAYADNSARTSGLLSALNAAAEETDARAEAARQLWPELVDKAVALHSEGRSLFQDHHYGIRALACLMPAPTHEVEFIFRELDGDPIPWRDPLRWDEAFEIWRPLAAGHPECVDSFIGMIRDLQLSDQATFGVPRLAALVVDDVDRVTHGSFLLSSWLREIRVAALASTAAEEWQQLVDALVVAGDQALAASSE
jgi:hypothetical protein